MDVSVVMSTYNRADIQRRTLSSFAQQTYPKDRFEVIVVDDGSSDHTKEVVDSFRGLLNLRYLYQPDEGYRVSKAFNFGASKAFGDILLLQNSDMIVCSHYVAHHVEKHQSFDVSLLVMGYVYGYWPGMDRTALCKIDFERVNTSKSILEKNVAFWDRRETIYRKAGDDLTSLLAPWVLSWGNMSARRKEFEAIGGFDEDFQSWGVEDVELGYRCFKRGLRFVLNREAWGVHYPHPITTTANKQTDKENYLLFYHKHPCPEVELRTTTRLVRYEMLLKQVQDLASDDLLPDYSQPQFREIWNTLRASHNGKLLIMGCGQGFLANALRASVGIEFDQDKLHSARRKFPAIRFEWALGVKLLYPDKAFGSVMITDFWRSLPRPCLSRILLEAVRLGEEVVVLCTSGFRPSTPKEGMPYSGITLEKLCRRLSLCCTRLNVRGNRFGCELYNLQPLHIRETAAGF